MLRELNLIVKCRGRRQATILEGYAYQYILPLQPLRLSVSKGELRVRVRLRVSYGMQFDALL